MQCYAPIMALNLWMLHAFHERIGTGSMSGARLCGLAVMLRNEASYITAAEKSLKNIVTCCHIRNMINMQCYSPIGPLL